MSFGVCREHLYSLLVGECDALIAVYAFVLPIYKQKALRKVCVPGKAATEASCALREDEDPVKAPEASARRTIARVDGGRCTSLCKCDDICFLATFQEE